jgi:hypothetical protein
VVGLFTVDDVLRFVFRGMVHIAFEPDGGSNLLDDYATNSAGFRVPFNVVAALKGLGHRTRLDSG